MFRILVLLAVLSNAAQGEPMNSVRLSLNYYEFDYREDVTPPLKSTEKGMLPGANLLYYHEPGPDTWFLRGGLDFAMAKARYDGSTQEGKPLVETNGHTLLSIQGTLGVSLMPGVALYSGLGGRYWRRGGEYSEEYSWLYAPMGLLVQHGFGGHLRVALDASVRLMFLGSIRVNLAELDSSLNNPATGLGSRIGYHLEIPLSYKVSSGVAAVLAPWFEYSAIGKSAYFLVTQNGSLVASGYEPNSRTFQYGGLAGILVEF